MENNATRWKSAVVKMRPILHYRENHCEEPNEKVPPRPSLVPLRYLSRNVSEESLAWKQLHTARAKLKASANTSEMLSLFTLVTMVEVQMNYPTEIPEWLLVLFAVSTTVLVSVHVLALMIATYLLPAIEPSAKLQILDESPHEKMKFFIDLAWVLSNSVGLFLFIVQLVILCWVKFYDYSHAAALTAMGLAVPSLILLVGFAAYVYKASLTAKLNSSRTEVDQLEEIRSKLDEVV